MFPEGMRLAPVVSPAKAVIASQLFLSFLNVKLDFGRHDGARDVQHPNQIGIAHGPASMGSLAKLRMLFPTGIASLKLSQAIVDDFAKLIEERRVDGQGR